MSQQLQNNGSNNNNTNTTNQHEQAKREAALIEAATILLRSLPPTYPFYQPPPRSIVDTNPLSLSGQLSVLFSIAANTARRLNNLNNQFLSPLLGAGAVAGGDAGGNASDNIDFNANYLGMTTTMAFGGTAVIDSDVTLYGPILKPFIIDYHYRNSTIIAIDAAVAHAVFGDAYVSTVFDTTGAAAAGAAASKGSASSPASATASSVSSSPPPLGLLLSPNTQLIQGMRRAAYKRSVATGEGAAGGSPPPRQLSVFAAETFLNAIQNDLLSLTVQSTNTPTRPNTAAAAADGGFGGSSAPSASGDDEVIVNVFTRPMPNGDIRLTGVDVSHLFVLPSNPFESTNTNGTTSASSTTDDANSNADGHFAFIAEVDMIDVEIIRVWRVDAKKATADLEAHIVLQQQGAASPPSPTSFSSKELIYFLAAAAGANLPMFDPAAARITSAVLRWAMGKGLGNAKQLAVSVGERLGAKSMVMSAKSAADAVEGDADDAADIVTPSSAPLYAVNIAAQQWSQNGMSAVTYRFGFSVDGQTLLPALSAAAASSVSPATILVSSHIDVWLLVADHDWVPNTDMSKTHVMNSFTVAEARRLYAGAAPNVEEEGAAAVASSSSSSFLGVMLDALLLRTIRACDDRLCNERDAKNVWLQHLRCQLPPTRNLFVFRESMPPQRPGFAKKA